jgi:hypothetical protein
MVTVEITNDTADALFNDILLQDYHGLVRSINELESRDADLEPYQIEDLSNDRRFKAAIEIMMEYYFTPAQMREAIGT